MTKEEALAMDLALEALKSAAGALYRATSYCDTYDALAETNNAIMDIQQARSAPVQELVAWLYPEGLEALRRGKCWTAYGTKQDDNCNIPVYLNAAIAPKVEPAKAECGGFDSHLAAPVQEPVQRWAVFCGGCRKEWSVPYQHPGKSICAECEAKCKATPPAQPAPVQDSTCRETLRAQGKAYPRTCKKCGKGPCIGAPAAPVQEPVAWRYDLAKYRENDLRGRQWAHSVFSPTKPYIDEMVRNLTPLYTTPPAAPVPLTYEQITAISKQVAEGGPEDSIDRFVRAIEAHHGITKV